MKTFRLLLCIITAALTLPLFAKTDAPHASDGGADISVNAAVSLYSSRKEVTNFFTHALVAHPDIAFKRDNGMRLNYDSDCLTVDEFKAVLSSLYENGYALVDIASTYRVSGGKAERCDFPFPKDKKPLVLTFDDINYYIKKMNLGMNDRLDADESGRLFTYTACASPRINYDNEVVTVLENFIALHPDFSFNGARGVLCLTGFDGVLGYRTQSGSSDRERETAAAKRVVSVLKAKGWRFACHSYGHYHMKKLTPERFALDTDKWLREVKPIVGETDIYVYPYGEWEITENGGAISPKHEHLKKRGFHLFCGVGTAEYYTRAALDSLFIDRKPLDGYSLRRHAKTYSRFFDCAALYDSRRPVPFNA